MQFDIGPAIATTTAALRDLLRHQIVQRAPDLADLVVTTKAPDQARGECIAPQINLFLFDAPVDPNYRNRQFPEAHEKEVPAPGVSLHYLITAYGREREDGDLTCHRVFGAAMAVMHRHSLLNSAELGPLRIIRLNMTAMEMATLWSAFQTPFRLSAAYAVGIVPIENA